MSDDPDEPVSVSEARALFAPWSRVPVLVLAVSGGPDSVAMMWLAARWRDARKNSPELIAVTVDHALRAESAKEARAVRALSKNLSITHVTRQWRGEKPKRGLPAAAREARYRLLAKTAKRSGALHVMTAHTRDDQAETLIMRLARGSGLGGLGGMARETIRGDVVVVRPFLDLPKSRLIATLDKAGIAYARDPTNDDVRFTRPRLRALMPQLAAEGADARALARLASRLTRADAALELMTSGAERYLRRLNGDASGDNFDLSAFSGLAPELRIRLLRRTIDRVGHEGPAELGKVEALVLDLESAVQTTKPLRRTLAGAIVSAAKGRLTILPAPLRRK